MFCFSQPFWKPICCNKATIYVSDITHDAHSNSHWPVHAVQAGPSSRAVCCRSPIETEGSNHAGDMDVCLLWVLGVVRWRSLRRADHSSRGDYRLVYVVVCDLETWRIRRPWPALGRSTTKKKNPLHWFRRDKINCKFYKERDMQQCPW